VVAQVARHGALIVVAGTACGLVLAAAGSSRLTDLLYQTSARDPLVYLGVAGVLVLAGLAAAIVPARRSAAVDPLVVLKSE
jgi:ABC-type antimicrobial peptide transport system permease subunit